MTITFDELLEILGKDENSVVFRRLIKNIREKPKVIETGKQNREFCFPRQGFSINSHQGFIYSLFFHLSTAATKSTAYHPFRGTFIRGILPTDLRQDVQKKMDKQPVESEVLPFDDTGETDHWDYYMLPPYALTFGFHTSNSRLSFISFSVEYSENASD
jgi:hypothetical protein